MRKHLLKIWKYEISFNIYGLPVFKYKLRWGRRLWAPAAAISWNLWISKEILWNLKKRNVKVWENFQIFIRKQVYALGEPLAILFFCLCFRSFSRLARRLGDLCERYAREKSSFRAARAQIAAASDQSLRHRRLSQGHHACARGARVRVSLIC